MERRPPLEFGIQWIVSPRVGFSVSFPVFHGYHDAMTRCLLLLAVLVAGQFQPPRPSLPSGEAPAISPEHVRTFTHPEVVWRATFSPDGRIVATGCGDHVIRLWDAAQGKELRTLPVENGGAVGLAFSPDGKTLASAPGGNVKEQVLRLWDVETGRILRTFEGHADIVYGVAFGPDGKRIASASKDRTVRVWDVATGKELAKFSGHTNTALRVAFSPDNQTLASGGDDSNLRLWNVSMNKETHALQHGSSIYGVAFSPDGRLVAAVGSGVARVWEVASGKEIRQFSSQGRGGFWVAFAPDSTLLAVAGGDQRVHLLEVLSGAEVKQLTGHTGSVKSVEFSRDGRLLVSASEDRKVMLWDLTRVAKQRAARTKLSATEMETMWSELAGSDAVKALEASWALAEVPAQSVPYLQQHLKHEDKPRVRAEQIAQWIKELDAESFAAREKATAELGKLQDLAEVPLRRALESKPSLEVQRRIEDLLSALDGRVLPPERLQALRGLGVLEKAGTPEAREVLTKLTQGPPDDWLTREAKLSLERLQRRLE